MISEISSQSQSNIEEDADPASPAHVRGAEIEGGRRCQEGLLNSRRGRTPEGDAVVVMMIGKHRELTAALDEPSGLTVTELFFRLRKCPAQGTNAVEGRHALIVTLGGVGEMLFKQHPHRFDLRFQSLDFKLG